MIIKKLSNKDINALYRLGLQEFRGEYWFKKKFLRESLNMPGYKYGAFEKNKLLGGIMATREDRPKLWIYFFVVGKHQRRKGIGGKLLRFIEKKSSKKFYIIFVDVGERDEIAKKFYRKHGFKSQAKIKDWFGKNYNGIIYSKKIV